MANSIIWYTFLAVAIYLVLTKWKGANALLSTSVGGYAKAVKTLQGR